jgi:hypothetical protein
VEEFLRRYLQHIPPSGYQTVRHYGLYSSGKKAAYIRCCEILARGASSQQDEANIPEEEEDSSEWLQQHLCPICGKALRVTAYIPSTLTGRVIPRAKIGSTPVHSPAKGVLHAPP